MARVVTAWDPGDTTGYAVWVDDTLVDMGQVSMEDIPQKWQEIKGKFGVPTHVVVEDYRLFKHRAVQQAGSQMKAPQGIGSLRTLASLEKAEFKLQPASNKVAAKKQFRVTIPSDHSQSHQWDAYLHGASYMLMQGWIKTPLMLEKEKQRGEG